MIVDKVQEVVRQLKVIQEGILAEGAYTNRQLEVKALEILRVAHNE